MTKPLAFLSARALSLAFAATLIAGPPALAWTPEKPVKSNSTPPGQVEWVQVIADGSGGTYTCWGDKRWGNWDVYVQHLNSSGAPVFPWPATGIDVSPVLGDQERPRIVSDGVGGVIVCWEDSRHNFGGKDIFAQRLTSAGAIVAGWPADGAQVCNEIANQEHVRVVPDGASGAVIAWRDLRDPAYPKFFAQRMSSAGAALWATNGVSGSPGFGEALTDILDVSADAASGAILAYIDAYGRLTAQRLAGGNGARLWNPNAPVPGVVLSSSAANGGLVPISVAADGQGGAFVAYAFYIAAQSTTDPYLHHVDSQGSPWAGDGTVLCNASGAQTEPRTASDGNDGAVTCWLDYRAGQVNNPDIFAQRVTSQGAIAQCWPSNGVTIANAIGLNGNDVITTDGRGGAVVGWQTSDNRVHGRRVSKEGGLDLPQQFSNTIATAPSIARASYGKAVTAWKDGRFAVPENAVFAQELAYSEAEPGGLAAGPEVSAQAGRTTAIVMWSGLPDDPTYGPIVSYEVRHSITPIWDFSSATLIGTVEGYGAFVPYCMDVSGLGSCTPNYFAVRGTFAACGYTFMGTAYAATRCNGNMEIACAGANPRPTDVEAAGIPATTEFAAPAPNPADASTMLRYGVPAGMAESPLEVGVFDLLGRQVRLLERGVAKPGRFSTSWDLRTEGGDRVGPGLYFVRFSVGDVRETRAVMIRR